MQYLTISKWLTYLVNAKLPMIRYWLAISIFPLQFNCVGGEEENGLYINGT